MVCLASTLIGCFFGLLAALEYQPISRGVPGIPPPAQSLFSVGEWTGGLGGLLAGLLWCRVMFRKALSREPDEELAGVGVKWGMLVGAATTVVLHAALFIADCVIRQPASYGAPSLILVSIGLICGVGAGGFLGLLSGAACKRVAKLALLQGTAVDAPPPGE